MKKLPHILSRLGLDQQSLESVCAKFKLERYKKNEFLLNQGQVAKKIFFIERGGILLGKESKEGCITRHLANENEFITVLDSFTKQQKALDFLKATEYTEAYAILKDDFDIILQRFPVIANFYHEFILDTLLRCQERITNLISLDASAYYDTILQTNPGIIQKMPQYDLASYMGIKPQSLSRVRKTVAKKRS